MRVIGLQSKLYSSSHFPHTFSLMHRLNIYDVQQIDPLCPSCGSGF